jgi:hypothetical protein
MLLSILVSTAVGYLLCTTLFSPVARANNTQEKLKKTHVVSSSKENTVLASGLSTTALKYAINGYRWAVKHHEVNNPTILTVVNFNEPSYKKRLYVIDLKNDRIIMKMHVAQGKNSGAVYATRFSNQPGSLESSPGIFTTKNTYDGEHGESLRINGLENGINNNAYSRAVVIHPASYVTPNFIKQNGYAGRSWGCFAVNPANADKFIHTVKDGSVLFAYAKPEKNDPRVDHRLSAKGMQLYRKITGESSSWFA